LLAVGDVFVCIPVAMSAADRAVFQTLISSMRPSQYSARLS
jgi:hypothetical protein